MNKYDLKNIPLDDLLTEVEQMEQCGDHDRARMASISIHVLKRTGKSLSTLMDERDVKKISVGTFESSSRQSAAETIAHDIMMGHYGLFEAGQKILEFSKDH